MSSPSVKNRTAPIVDWSKTPLTAEYEGPYVKIIDDVFSADECSELISLAESDAKWEQAGVNYGGGPNDKYVDTSYRNCLRILRFDSATASRIYARLQPFVPELVKIEPEDKWSSIFGKNVYSTWECVGMYDRLSFLKYEEGHFYAKHCDGLLQKLPDGRECRVTIQIYLGEDGVEGGTTRIHGPKGRYFDVEPKKGRALIFQHRNVYHSAEKVTCGLKYALRSDFLFRETKPAPA